MIFGLFHGSEKPVEAGKLKPLTLAQELRAYWNDPVIRTHLKFSALFGSTALGGLAGGIGVEHQMAAADPILNGSVKGLGIAYLTILAEMAFLSAKWNNFKLR